MARAFRPPRFRIPVPSKIPSLRVPRLPDTSQPDVFEEMTLGEHLDELKRRIVRMGIAIVGGLILGFLFARPLLRLIAETASQEGTLDIRNPAESLTVTFQVALYIAICVTSPVLLFQLIAFLAPGLTNREKRIVYTSLPFVALLFIGGACYAFFFAIPQALNFLQNFADDVYAGTPDARETVNFYLTIMVGLGLAFQLPLVMFLLAKLGIFSPEKMRKWRKYSYLVIIIISAMITPTTDPVNLALVALPLVILYEVGIILSRILVRGNTTRGAEAVAA
ncbi:MAG TPA: twin-arginine translocase subunit TatC [Thermomicrobiales bacterium]|jgi:sec-independent protein translocase protein TatC|nr:twin-arginine translocase subunit TatC [Thermomicrobiales bacterium]